MGQTLPRDFVVSANDRVVSGNSSALPVLSEYSADVCPIDVVSAQVRSTQFGNPASATISDTTGSEEAHRTGRYGVVTSPPPGLGRVRAIREMETHGDTQVFPRLRSS